jgi:hypothetical protein
MHELIQKTWAEVGFRYRPLRKLVCIRTEARPYKSHHGIWFPPDLTGTFDKDKSTLDVTLYARVLSVGPKVKILKPGDRIFISRLYFAWIRKLTDGTYMGSIDIDNIFGLADEEKVEVESFHAIDEDDRPRASCR